jgi:hypothetical protein
MVPPPPRPFARIAILVAGLLALAACAPPAATAIVSGPSALSIAIASNDFEAGQPRVPFVLYIGAQPLGDARSVQLTAFDLASGTPVPGWSGAATAYNDYDIPYWVAYPDLPHAGYWGLGAVITLADGTQTQGSFTLEALADASAPEIGETPPASQNRTRATVPDLALLTSDPQPELALYDLTVAEALTSGKPSVITFATPGFCESRLCAPVVDSVKAVRAGYAERVNFIHVEIYQSFDPFVYVPEMDEWGLTSEPWTFVLDADGAVTARLGGPVSPAELRALLAAVAGE